MSSPRPRSRLGAREFLLTSGLVAVTAAWGSTFVMVKDAVERVPPLTFNTARFAVATVALGAICIPQLRRLGRDGLLHGMILGVALFAGYAFQTVGLRHIDATVAGFITGMFVVFTPLLSAVALRRRPGRYALAGVALAAAGLAMLSLPAETAARAAGAFGGLALSFGSALMLACALSFAAQIVGLGAWARRHDALPLTVVQLATVAVLHAPVALALEARAATAGWDRSVLIAVIFTALVASAFGFWMQTTAQRVIPPTRAAVILTMEPVFAGLAGFLVLGERLSALGWAGSALILVAMLTAEIAPARRDAAARRVEAAQRSG